MAGHALTQAQKQQLNVGCDRGGDFRFLCTTYTMVQLGTFMKILAGNNMYLAISRSGRIPDIDKSEIQGNDGDGGGRRGIWYIISKAAYVYSVHCADAAILRQLFNFTRETNIDDVTDLLQLRFLNPTVIAIDSDSETDMDTAINTTEIIQHLHARLCVLEQRHILN